MARSCVLKAELVSGFCYTNVGTNLLVSTKTTEQDSTPNQTSDCKPNGPTKHPMSYFENKFLFESPAHPYAVCRQALFNVHTLFQHTTVAFYGSSNVGKDSALKEFYAYFFEYANRVGNLGETFPKRKFPYFGYSSWKMEIVSSFLISRRFY